MIKLYYCPELNIIEDYRIIPVPKISITQNLVYNNDIIIGYTYTVNLNGYATNYIAQYNDLLPESGSYELAFDDTNTIITEDGFIKVLYSVDLIRKILSKNGNCLFIRDKDNNNILVARGGTLRSLSFENNDNSWNNYANYNASIEFNELLLFNDNFTCNSGYMDDESITSQLVDLNQYKLSSFSDNWSFDIDDTSLNYAVSGDVMNSTLNVYNSTINLTYNISATGKNYFIEDKMIPGWIQAKNFAQKRLYDQVTQLSSILSLNGNISGCYPTKSLANINNIGNSGALNNISLNYKLYNETITCDTSESDGTFNLIYNAILKINENNNFSSSGVIHNFTKDYSINKEGQKTNVTISIDGTITGLCDGGLVSSSGNFSLPSKGTLVVTANNNTKFTNALNFLPKIINNNDLTSIFKEKLGINTDALAVPSGTGICSSGISPVNFTLTKNYMEGNITYNVEYTTNRTCTGNGSITNMTIDIQEPAPVIAEFAVPGGNYIIQDIGTVTARSVSLSVEGKMQKDCCINNTANSITDYISSYCDKNITAIIPDISLPDESTHIVTEKTLSTNPIEGTYSMNLSYICKSGCII